MLPTAALYLYSSFCKLGLFLQPFCQIPPSLSMSAQCAAGRDTAPGYQQHSACLGHQLCVKTASVLCGMGWAVVPNGRSLFEWRRTQGTSQHKSFWQSDLDVGTVSGKASTTPPCTTIRFPDPFSVQLLIPVMGMVLILPFLPLQMDTKKQYPMQFLHGTLPQLELNACPLRI